MLFRDNLHNILQVIYQLVHRANFSAGYVESICPLERELYWAYWQQEQQEKAKTPGNYTAMDDNIPQGINTQGLM